MNEVKLTPLKAKESILAYKASIANSQNQSLIDKVCEQYIKSAREDFETRISTGNEKAGVTVSPHLFYSIPEELVIQGVKKACEQLVVEGWDSYIVNSFRIETNLINPLIKS